MKIPARSEEILERLWIALVEENKDGCDATLIQDQEAFHILLEEGYVHVKKNVITLSRKGKEESRNCVRRHRLAERLMVDVFDLKNDAVHKAGCEFEHIIHKGLEENICTLLGHPRMAPNGKPIPEGVCCREIKKYPDRILMPLAELKKNTRARVAYLHTNKKDALQKILAMGILPNKEISVLEYMPSLVFKLGKSQFAIDSTLAKYIVVRIVT